MEEKLFKALSDICWYNGHYEWLLNVAMYIDNKSEEEYSVSLKEICPNIYVWGTEEHFIYMILVSMFGNWGTSIRSGWLELKNKKEIVNFLKKLLIDSWLDYEDYDTYCCTNNDENKLTKEDFDKLQKWLKEN